MKPLTFSILRLLSDGNFHSGEALARYLGVSRASISNGLKTLEELGINIYKVRGRGYCLQDPLQWLDKQQVVSFLGDHANDYTLEIHDVMDSSNSLLLQDASKGLVHRSCYVTELQLQGRGRRGRAWHMNLGGALTFSLLWRFNQGAGFLSGLSLAVGVALVAETMPDAARPQAIGLLQALSTVGNVTAALISISFGHLEQSGHIGSAWRAMFIVGAFPALLAILVRRNLKEPERWQQIKKTPVKGQLGSYAELLGNPVWRRRALLGMALACCGVIGLWGIGFFSIDLIRSVLRKTFEAEGLTGAALDGRLTKWAGIASMMVNFGAFFGIYGFSVVAQRIGRLPTFAIGLVLACVSTGLVFWNLRSFTDIFWMLPLMGLCQLSLFGGFAVYFPELFPTHLRSTGVSFCYNVGRVVAALGPSALGYLTGVVFKDKPEPMRYAGLAMCSIFLLALFVLPFLPETKGQPLPESDRGLSH